MAWQPFAANMSKYHKFLVILSTAVFFSNFPEWNAQFTKLPSPIHWVMGIYVLALPILFRTLRKSDVLRSPVMLWAFGFIWFTMAWFLLFGQNDMAWQEIQWRIHGLLIICGVLILLWDPDAVRVSRYTVAAGVLFGVAINVYDFFVPMSFSKLPGRSAGLYGDPNFSAESLVLGMLVSITALPAWWRGSFMLTTGIGVCLTISRSGILAWVCVCGVLILLNKVRMKGLLMTVALGLVLIIVVLLPMGDQLLTELERKGVINKNLVERLDWFADPTGVSDHSSWERKRVAREAWEKVAERPWTGSGPGSSRTAIVGTHNQYLAHMRDHGLLGAGIVPLLLLALSWRAQGETKQLALLFGCVVMWQCFFSHTILDQAPRLSLFGLMGAFAWASRSYAFTQAQSLHAGNGMAPRAWSESANHPFSGPKGLMKPTRWWKGSCES